MRFEFEVAISIKEEILGQLLPSIAKFDVHRIVSVGFEETRDGVEKSLAVVGVFLVPVLNSS
jgi:hypothetical protein